MPTIYKFTCKRCGHIWMASQATGNNKCPKCGTQAYPYPVK